MEVSKPGAGQWILCLRDAGALSFQAEMIAGNE